jgi:WD40 repeat protein
LLCARESDDLLLFDRGSPAFTHMLPVPASIHSSRQVFSPAGDLLASVGREEVLLWDTASPRLVRGFDRLDIPVPALAFHPDGRSLAVAVRGEVRLLDIDTGRARARFATGEATVTSLAVHPAGLTLAAGSDDGLIIWWDLDEP